MTDMHTAPEERALYLWAAHEKGTSHGARGVTDTPHTAELRLLEALDAMPGGGEGTIHRARLDTAAHPYPDYEHGPVQVRARRHHKTGAISIRGQVR